MIKGKQLQLKPDIDKPTFNYRKLDALNQSMIKLFDNDPVKFFEQFKMGKVRKDKKNASLIIGDLVDFFLLECSASEEEFDSRFDERFSLFNGTKTGQVILLADYIFEETENCINQATGEIGCSFETRFNDAVKRIRAEDKYKGKTDEKILEDFLANGKTYFDLRMASLGKTVVELSLVDKAKIVANKIKKDPFTKSIFVSSEDVDYFTHFPIEFNYYLDKDRMIGCKAELDMLFVDKHTKQIQPMDLKTTYDNESFDLSYIKNGYYLQNAFYTKAVEAWAQEEGLGDYAILPMKFLVGDTSSNNRRPLIYSTTEKDLEAGLKGFMLKGMKHRGVEELIEDIAWAEENNEWSCSREAFFNKGKMKLQINYE